MESFLQVIFGLHILMHNNWYSYTMKYCSLEWLLAEIPVVMIFFYFQYIIRIILPLSPHVIIILVRMPLFTSLFNLYSLSSLLKIFCSVILFTLCADYYSSNIQKLNSIHQDGIFKAFTSKEQIYSLCCKIFHEVSQYFLAFNEFTYFLSKPISPN